MPSSLFCASQFKGRTVRRVGISTVRSLWLAAIRDHLDDLWREQREPEEERLLSAHAADPAALSGRGGYSKGASGQAVALTTIAQT